MLQSATPTGKPAARRRARRSLCLALILLTLALALPAGAFAFTDLNGIAFSDVTHGRAVGYDRATESGLILGIWSAQRSESSRYLWACLLYTSPRPTRPY